MCACQCYGCALHAMLPSQTVPSLPLSMQVCNPEMKRFSRVQVESRSRYIVAVAHVVLFSSRSKQTLNFDDCMLPAVCCLLSTRVSGVTISHSATHFPIPSILFVGLKGLGRSTTHDMPALSRIDVLHLPARP